MAIRKSYEHQVDVNQLVERNDINWINISNGLNSYAFEFTIEPEDNPMVLRLQSIHSSRFVEEAQIISKLAKTSIKNLIPGPPKIGELKIEDKAYAYSLENKIYGCNLSDILCSDNYTRVDKIDMIRNLGGVIAKLHSNNSNGGFGLLDKNGYAEYNSLDKWTASILKRHTGAIKHSTSISDDTIQFQDILAEANKYIYKHTEIPVICHGDLIPRNILVSPELRQVTGLIDLEHCKSHFRELDIAYWKFYWQGDEPLEAILDGYGKPLDRKLVDYLALYRGIDAMAYWAENNNTNNYDKSFKRLREICISLNKKL